MTMYFQFTDTNDMHAEYTYSMLHCPNCRSIINKAIVAADLTWASDPEPDLNLPPNHRELPFRNPPSVVNYLHNYPHNVPFRSSPDLRQRIAVEYTTKELSVKQRYLFSTHRALGMHSPIAQDREARYCIYRCNRRLEIRRYRYDPDCDRDAMRYITKQGRITGQELLDLLDGMIGAEL